MTGKRNRTSYTTIPAYDIEIILEVFLLFEIIQRIK
nr:MAG TPA: hypothetical protein [Caudoviricetes sp.]